MLHRLHYSVDRILFFFSSRRRHTRWPRDWSSDVCSSDLSRVGFWSTTRRGSDGDWPCTDGGVPPVCRWPRRWHMEFQPLYFAAGQRCSRVEPNSRVSRALNRDLTTQRLG